MSNQFIQFFKTNEINEDLSVLHTNIQFPRLFRTSVLSSNCNQLVLNRLGHTCVYKKTIG